MSGNKTITVDLTNAEDIRDKIVDLSNGDPKVARQIFDQLIVAIHAQQSPELVDAQIAVASRAKAMIFGRGPE